MLSYEAAIIKALSKFGTGDTKNPDEKHNVGNMLGEYFLWKTIAKYAEGRYETVLKKMIEDKIIDQPKEAGSYEIAHSPHFTMKATVTQPVKRFSPDELAKMMNNSKYKVPVPYMKEKIEDAKVPTASQTRREVVETV